MKKLIAKKHANRIGNLFNRLDVSRLMMSDCRAKKEWDNYDFFKANLKEAATELNDSYGISTSEYRRYVQRNHEK